jgi:uncharacterized protein (DUF58 family)
MGFVALFAVLGGAARGFNLLVILAGLMVGILLMQWRFCRATLPGLTIRRSLPSQAFAGTPFRVRFVLTNHRRWLPAWLLQVQDRIRGPQLSSRGAPAQCAVAIARPGESQSTHYDCVIHRRGRYRFGPVRLATGFPFGLINAWKNTRSHAPLVVYPRLAKLQPHWTGVIENNREGLSSARRSSGPSEGEFFGIRGWQSGDSKRWIHWRTTARIGELAVRQFEQRNRTQISLILDPYSTRQSTREDDPDLEWAISVAAAIVVQAASQATSRLAFAMADGQERVLVSHRLTDFSRAALQLLATVKGQSAPPLTATLGEVLRVANPNWPILVVSPRARQPDLIGAPRTTTTQNELPAEAAAPGKAASARASTTEEISSALLARLDLLWLDVTSEAAQRVAVGREVAHGSA